MTSLSPFVTAAALVFLSNSLPLFTQPATGARRFLPIEWKKVVVLEGALDSDLLRPALMVARDSTVYLYDYGDRAVKAFGMDGRLRWRFGREGSGPGEFQNPTHLQLDQSGLLWLADPAASRVTVISGTGRLVRTVSTAIMTESVLPLGAGRFVGTAFVGDRPRFERFDSLGRAQGRIKHPTWMDTVPSLVSELRVTATPDDKRIVFASFYSGRLMQLAAGDSVIKDIRSIETHSFPKKISYSPRKGMTVNRISPEARPTIRSITADDEFAYALILGSHEERGRIIDLYRLRDGTYAGSWLLPERVHEISITSRGIAVLVTDELPSLYFFEKRLRR